MVVVVGRMIDLMNPGTLDIIFFFFFSGSREKGDVGRGSFYIHIQLERERLGCHKAGRQAGGRDGTRTGWMDGTGRYLPLPSLRPSIGNPRTAEIGRAHVRTPVTRQNRVCRLRMVK